jgi:glycosyltransferase involved in cell wall biosynthesis
MTKNIKIAILGTVGIPANYGGFETLVENLVKYHKASSLSTQIMVYCSSRAYPLKHRSFLSAQLKYVPLHANGTQSILYDITSLISAIWNRSNVILLLGVSGAVALPLVRIFSSTRIVTNIDGIEWRRKKWQGLAKLFLRFSEKVAVRFSHEVISDNGAIAEYVKQTYGVVSHVIAYGGDHAIEVGAATVDEYYLPESYSFSVCRIEPENNVHIILDAFSKLSSHPLVIVGNWMNSEYGRTIRERYSTCKHFFLLDPIYDLGKLKTLRLHALLYLHGHSAGGTNPSLVEAMHFGKPVLAFDCDFNRNTTEDKAFFFKTSADLLQLVETMDVVESALVGRNMLEIAERRYTWKVVAEQYFSLLTSQSASPENSNI